MVERKYKHPSILEALCEVQFETPEDWNTACYGILMAAVRDMGFEQTEEIPAFALQVDVRQKETLVLPTLVLMRYKHANGKNLLHLGPNSFTINQLAPYTGWHEFKPYIVECLRRLHESLPSIQPSRLILRYINRFAFTGMQTDMAEWFSVYPVSPDIGQRKGPFLLKQDFFCTGEDVLTVTTGLAYVSPSDGTAVLLDLEYRTSEFLWDLLLIDSILERSHDAVYEAFEACITEKTRGLLEEVR
ncbi:MAG: TIGR04255 family protein [Armatimonadota bacterium]